MKNSVIKFAAVCMLSGFTAQADTCNIPNASLKDASNPFNIPPCASPSSYSDDANFTARVSSIVKALSTEDLQKWRRGYFAGGDPGKYAIGAAMAHLIVDPKDEQALEIMNDKRSPKEHYHFAVVNWSRFYPLFGKKVLTPETDAQLKANFKKYNYLSPGGTENHKTMWMTSVNVLPYYLKEGTNHKSYEETIKTAKEQLRYYVKGLYTAGAGEWDSSTYTLFTLNGLLNIYDFSPDPECRLLAQAGLDLLVSGYALKYTDGIFCAPNQRGHYTQPFQSTTDQTGYVWWGDASDLNATNVTRAYRYALHAGTSAWKPNRVLCNIANKTLKSLPSEQRNSKANYWYGQRLEPKPGSTQESIWMTPTLTMGSLWNGHSSQHTRFMIAAEDENGAVAFSGGHPRKSDHNSKKIGLGVTDGTGRYVQSAQIDNVYVCMANAPEDEEADWSYLTYPEGYTPETVGKWKRFVVGKNVIAVYPLTGEAEERTFTVKKKDIPILAFPGRKSGFFVVVGGNELTAKKLKDYTPDTSKFLSDLTVSWESKKYVMQFNPAENGIHGNRACTFSIDGEKLDVKSWDIYSGPYVKQSPGRLEVSNGTDGYAIDFTGNLPKYSKLEN